MGHDRGAASALARARKGRRRGRRGIRLPDAVTIKCPPGTRDRIEEAADFDGLTPAEWLRAALRAALDAARKRMARAAKNGAT